MNLLQIEWHKNILRKLMIDKIKLVDNKYDCIGNSQIIFSIKFYTKWREINGIKLVNNYHKMLQIIESEFRIW